jgi:transposase-like protein
MAVIPVVCPQCGKSEVVRRGRTDQGKQRYLCVNEECSKKTFILDYSYNGTLPETKARIVDMALNGSGVRDTARVLGVSQTTVIKELKNRYRPIC